MFKYFKKLINYTPKIIGIATILYYTSNYMAYPAYLHYVGIDQNCSMKSLDYYKTGNNKPTYALITGGTAGIGGAYANEIAKRGVNLILVSRKEQNLRLKKKQLQQKYKVSIQLFSFDFSINNVNQYHLFNQVFQKFDIGILVNNVAYAIYQQTQLTQQQEIHKLINTNVLATTIMTKKFIKANQKRSAKSAIINLGCLQGDYLSNKAAFYNASKSYIHALSQNLQQYFNNYDKSIQKQQDFDCIVVKPGPTMTSQYSHIYPRYMVVSAEDQAAQVFRRIGKMKQIWGMPVHGWVRFLKWIGISKYFQR